MTADDHGLAPMPGGLWTELALALLALYGLASIVLQLCGVGW